MGAVHPVGDPLTDCVVFNAGADDIAATALFVLWHLWRTRQVRRAAAPA